MARIKVVKVAEDGKEEVLADVDRPGISFLLVPPSQWEQLIDFVAEGQEIYTPDEDEPRQRKFRLRSR